jgi:hypothetical protein
MDSSGSTQVPENPCGGDGAYFPGEQRGPCWQPTASRPRCQQTCCVASPTAPPRLFACSPVRVLRQLRGVVPVCLALRAVLRRRLRARGLPVARRRRVQHHPWLQRVPGRRNRPAAGCAGAHLPLLLPQPQVRRGAGDAVPALRGARSGAERRRAARPLSALPAACTAAPGGGAPRLALPAAAAFAAAAGGRAAGGRACAGSPCPGAGGGGPRA